MPTNLFSYVGKNAGIANEGINEKNLINNNLNDGYVKNDFAFLGQGNVIRINVTKNKLLNEKGQINNNNDEEE